MGVPGGQHSGWEGGGRGNSPCGHPRTSDIDTSHGKGRRSAQCCAGQCLLSGFPRALICNVCQFPWCKCSHCGQVEPGDGNRCTQLVLRRWEHQPQHRTPLAKEVGVKSHLAGAREPLPRFVDWLCRGFNLDTTGIY